MTNWIALRGKVEVVDDGHGLKHIPLQPADATAQPLYAPLTIARSNIQFEQGTISFKTLLKDKDARCQLVLNSGHQMEINVGLNVLSSAYGVAVFKNDQWEVPVYAGFGDKAALDRWICIKVRVVGSVIELYVDGVKVCVYSGNVQRSQIAFYLQGFDEVVVKDLNITTSSPECFVVMQFTEEFNTLYEEVIKPTCKSFGFNVVRGDDNYSSGLIIEDITRSIDEASVIIADITPNNLNVFYEVGYAHGIRKPTILLSERKREKLPFDISGFRTLSYDNTIGGKGQVEQQLRKHLESILA